MYRSSHPIVTAVTRKNTDVVTFEENSRRACGGMLMTILTPDAERTTR